MLIVAMLVFGATAAYYIPLIPYIAGITAAIKWFVLVFESVIAAPIWAAAHVHPDGDDAAGRGGAGYMLITGLFMRPVLTVFGFFGSIMLAQPITGLINNTYAAAVYGAEQNSLTGPTTFVAYVGIYVIIMTTVIHSVFTLVTWVPDNVLRWFGHTMGGVHGLGDRESGEAHGAFIAAATHGRQVAGQRGGGGGGGGGGDVKQALKDALTEIMEGKAGGKGGTGTGEKDSDHFPHGQTPPSDSDKL